MQVTIEKNEFLRGLRLAKDIAEKKSTMPILSNVLLRSSDDGLELIASDLSIALTARLSASVAENGAVTVAAKALKEVIASMPHDDVTMSVLDTTWVRVTSGDVEYTLAALSPNDFPRVHDPGTSARSSVNAELLLELIEGTIIATATDEARFNLNGCLVESSDGETRMVSTDGHRMAFMRRVGIGFPDLNGGIIVPRKGLLQLKSLLSGVQSCEVTLSAEHLFVEVDGLLLSIKLTDAQFPPYELVIPKNHTKHVSLSRTALLDALKRAQIVAPEALGVLLEIEQDSLTFSCDNPGHGTMKERIAIEYDGEPMAVKLSARYAVEFLSAFYSDVVTISLEGELDQVLLRQEGNDSHLGVVMPMRA